MSAPALSCYADGGRLFEDGAAGTRPKCKPLKWNGGRGTCMSVAKYVLKKMKIECCWLMDGEEKGVVWGVLLKGCKRSGLSSVEADYHTTRFLQWDMVEVEVSVRSISSTVLTFST